MSRAALVLLLFACLLSLTVSRASALTVEAAFADCATPGISIHDIQGVGHLSRCRGQQVSGVTGIVTAVRNSGFYIQDPVPDEDSAFPPIYDCANPPAPGQYLSAYTSEGIFVYTISSGDKPAIGDRVSVAGAVLEYRAAADDLSVTEISEPTFTILSSDNPLPAPVILHTSGIRTSSVDDDNDSDHNIETEDNVEGACFDPERDAIDYFESFEGMRVRIDNPVATGGTDANGHLPVLMDGGIDANPLLAGRGLLLSAADPNPERIYLDDSINGVSIPPVWSGTRFTGPAIGVLHYQYSNYRVVLTQALPLNPHPGAGEPAESVAAAAPEQLTAAAYNVENLSIMTATSARFSLLAAQIVNQLKAPDLLVLEEVQDDDGNGEGTTSTSAAATLGALSAAIQSAGGPAYSWLQIDPEPGQDGGAANANIRQVILYNPARLTPAAAPAGDYAAAVGLTPGAPHLTYNPGRIEPGASVFNDSRKPLAAEFSFQGQPVFVVACHLNSKIGDDPIFGPRQPPRLSTQNKRSGQAALINAFVSGLLARDPRAYVLVLGDLNEHAWAEPLQILADGGDAQAELRNLADFLPADEAHYTYIYEGNAQALDHIYASAAFGTEIRADDVHLNAERAALDPLHASDHDPVWAAFPMPVQRVYLPLVSKH